MFKCFDTTTNQTVTADIQRDVLATPKIVVCNVLHSKNCLKLNKEY